MLQKQLHFVSFFISSYHEPEGTYVSFPSPVLHNTGKDFSLVLPQFLINKLEAIILSKIPC